MRLIDADELKKVLAEYKSIRNFNMNYDGLLAELIDNAPTVNKCNNCDLMLLEKTRDKDYDQYMKGHKDGYKQAIIDGKLDMRGLNHGKKNS